MPTRVPPFGEQPCCSHYRHSFSHVWFGHYTLRTVSLQLGSQRVLQLRYLHPWQSRCCIYQGVMICREFVHLPESNHLRPPHRSIPWVPRAVCYCVPGGWGLGLVSCRSLIYEAEQTSRCFGHETFIAEWEMPTTHWSLFPTQSANPYDTCAIYSQLASYQCLLIRLTGSGRHLSVVSVVRRNCWAEHGRLPGEGTHNLVDASTQ